MSESAELPGKPPAPRAILAEQRHLKELVRCHMESLPDEAVTALGKGVVSALYRYYIRRPGGFVLVTLDEQTGRVSGLTLGEEAAFCKRFVLAHLPRIALAVACKVFTSPQVRYRVAEAFSGGDDPASAEGQHAGWPEEPPGTFVRLRFLATNPNYRRRGIASSILEAFRQECAQRGCKTMRVMTPNDNAAAIATYKKCGWRVVYTSASHTYFWRNVSEEGAPGELGAREDDGNEEPMADSPELPLFSIVLPIRNEAEFIEQTIASIQANDYPRDRVEMIVVDGMSDDGTLAIVQRIAVADPRIRILTNPKRVVPSGMNIGIRDAKGEFIEIVGGHAWLHPSHVSQAVRTMREHPDAWRVGGVMETVGTGYIGQVIAATLTHPVGVGSGNAARTGKVSDGHCRDVPFPVVRRWYYDKVGLFDEQFVRNQDTDMTLRAMDLGCVSYLSTAIRSKYFARTSFRKLFHQHFMDGYFRIRNIQKSRRPASPRQVVPLAFVLAWVVLILASLFWRPALMGLAALAGLYLLALLGGAVSVALARGWRVGALTPLAFALMHFGYGLGSLKGVWAWLICRGRFVPRPEDHGITR